MQVITTPKADAPELVRRETGYVLVLPEGELSEVLALALQDLLHEV